MDESNNQVPQANNVSPGGFIPQTAPVPPVTSMPPVPSRPQMPPLQGHPKGRTGKVIVVCVVILLVLGGVAYGYWTYIANPTNKVTLGTATVKTINGVKNGDIKSVELTSSAQLTVKKSDQVVATTTNPYSQSLADINSATLTSNWSAIIDGTVADNLKSSGKISLSLSVDAKTGSQIGTVTGMGPLTLEAEYMLFTDAVYFKINKLPSALTMYTTAMGVDTSKYLGNWYVYKDQKSIAMFNLGLHSVLGNISSDDMAKLDTALIKFLDQSGAYTVNGRQDETTPDGEKVTAIDMSINKAKFLPAYVAFIKDIQAIFPNQLNNQTDLDKALNDPKLGEAWSGIDFSGMKILVNAQGYLAGGASTVNMSSKEIPLTLSEKIDNTIKNYNKNFNLQAPQGARDINEVIAEIQQQMMKSTMISMQRPITQTKPVCVQLGTKGSFVAPKSGSLYLLFNDWVNGYGDNAKSYTVNINGKNNIVVSGTSEYGTYFGPVIVGNSYSYSAGGKVQFNWAGSSNSYDAPSGTVADPDGIAYSWDSPTVPVASYKADTHFVCPGLKGISLIGQIR